MQETTFLSKLSRAPWVILVLASLLIAMMAAPLTAGAHHKPGHAGGPPGSAVSVEFVDFVANHPGLGEGTFNGTFNINRFEIVDGKLFAVGTVVGEFVSSNPGHTVAVNESNVMAPVGNQQGDRCPILHLTLGPLFLDLLGLVIEIPEPIILDIYAVPGPGRLLGNLLCAIAGLLDPPQNGNAAEAKLNQVNRLLAR
jgi:hypothetical protein